MEIPVNYTSRSFGEGKNFVSLIKFAIRPQSKTNIIIEYNLLIKSFLNNDLKFRKLNNLLTNSIKA